MKEKNKKAKKVASYVRKVCEKEDTDTDDDESHDSWCQGDDETQDKTQEKLQDEENSKIHWPDEMKDLVEDVYDKIVSAHDHEEMIVKKTLLEETAGKKHLVTNPTMTTSVRKRNAHCVIRYLSIFVGEHLA